MEGTERLPGMCLGHMGVDKGRGGVRDGGWGVKRRKLHPADRDIKQKVWQKHLNSSTETAKAQVSIVSIVSIRAND